MSLAPGAIAAAGAATGFGRGPIGRTPRGAATNEAGEAGRSSEGDAGEKAAVGAGAGLGRIERGRRQVTPCGEQPRTAGRGDGPVRGRGGTRARLGRSEGARRGRGRAAGEQRSGRARQGSGARAGGTPGGARPQRTELQARVRAEVVVQGGAWARCVWGERARAGQREGPSGITTATAEPRGGGHDRERVREGERRSSQGA
nr:fibroin heavy chain-like [Aegilops tauschii subsp. strangulata]